MPIVFLNTLIKPKGRRNKRKHREKPAKKKNPLFKSRPKNFRIGGTVQHKRDLTRFVRWPRYIIL